MNRLSNLAKPRNQQLQRSSTPDCVAKGSNKQSPEKLNSIIKKQEQNSTKFLHDLSKMAG